MNEILLFGCTMFSSEMRRIIEYEMGGEIIGYVVDRQFIEHDKYDNLPIYAFEELNSIFDMKKVGLLLTVGYSKMNKIRQEKYYAGKALGYRIASYISKKALVYSDNIAEGSIILPGCYIGPFSIIGKCNVIKSGVHIPHHCQLGNFNWIAGGTIFGGGVKMEDYCFIGLGSTIRNEIFIANETFIGANAYLSFSTEPCGVYYGVPARKITDKISLDVINKV